MHLSGLENISLSPAIIKNGLSLLGIGIVLIMWHVAGINSLILNNSFRVRLLCVASRIKRFSVDLNICLLICMEAGSVEIVIFSSEISNLSLKTCLHGLLQVFFIWSLISQIKP